jgi:hypothetical protein
MSDTPKAAGFYKIVTGIEGLAPWAQYFDGESWHGASPPPNAKVYAVTNGAEGPEERESEHLPEPEIVAADPNIEIQQFKCSACSGTQISRRANSKNGVISYELCCEFCESAEERLPRLPLRNAGGQIVDDDGHPVAMCDWRSKGEHINAETARLIVAAVNSWHNLTELVNSDDPGVSFYHYNQIVKKVRDFQMA